MLLFYSKFRTASAPIQETQQDEQGSGKGCTLQLPIKSEPSTRSDLANVKTKFRKDEQCGNPQEHEQEAQIYRSRL